MKTKNFYIKQRNNPQLGVYFVPMGQMTKASAKAFERTAYGSNKMIPFENEVAYKEEIERLKNSGETIR